MAIKAHARWPAGYKAKTASEITAAYTKRHPERAKESVRRTRLKKKFGITLEEYDELFEEQDGVCAICGGINANGYRLAIDHDHQTGAIRGLLCTNCNHGLGKFKDNPELMALAIDYLMKEV